MGRLIRGLGRLGLLVVALSSTAPVFAEGTPTPAEQILILVNQRRAEEGLRPLRIQSQLQAAAQGYAEYMARTGVFSHTGRDGSTPFSRMAAAGYRGTLMGENIARGFNTAASVMDAWMNSPGHRANILNPGYTDLGIGIAGNTPSICWVQNFGASEVEADAEAPRPVPLGPTIPSIAPLSGRPGDPVAINGQRFGDSPGSVTFSGGQRGETSSWSDNRIVTRVPNGALTGPIYVQTENGTAAGPSLYVLPTGGFEPSIQRISPSSAAPGTVVTIYGNRLGSSQGSVSFNGVPAVITHWSYTGYFVSVLVPANAGSGPVVLRRGADGSSSNAMSFTVAGSRPPQSAPVTSPVVTTPVVTSPPPPVSKPSPQPNSAYPFYRFRWLRR
jgi:hypothetical protein